MTIEQVIRVVFDGNALMHMGCGLMGSTSSAAATVETLHRDGEGEIERIINEPAAA